MTLTTHIKISILLFVAFLLGGQTSLSKTAPILLDYNNDFVVVQSVRKKSLKKVVLINVSFKKEKEALGDQINATQKTNVDDAVVALRNFAEGVDDLISNLTNKLIARGLNTSIVDDIIIRSMYIDDAIGTNKMTSLLDDIIASPKFKNPEDLLDNLNGVYSGSNVNSISANNLLKEFEEGKYWISQGEDVYISKKWTTNGNEVDVTITTKNALVECKNVIGGVDAVRDNINSIILKFTDESKLSSSIKSLYPNHYGKISISNPSNPYYSLNKTQIIDKIRLELLNQPGGISKNSLINSISELHIETSQGRFIIKSTEW
jgi:hypothetical protein